MASRAQTSSHADNPQKASNAVTVAQQVASAQPGADDATKQLFGAEPQPAQIEFARDAQSVSQEVLQQNASSAQVSAQQASSLHPGVAWTAKQLPVLQVDEAS